MYAVKMTIKSKWTDEGLIAFAGKRGVVKHNPSKVDAWMRKASAEK